MGIFNWRRAAATPIEERNEDAAAEDVLLRRQLQPQRVTTENVLEIPAVAACVRLISETIARLPVKLYSRAGDDVQEITGDRRIKLLNDETGDLLSPFQMKANFVSDYLIYGDGHIYINRELNNVASLNYAPRGSVSVVYNTDTLFKRGVILVDGREYYPFEFLTIAQNSKKGLSGQGVVDTNGELLGVVYNAMRYETNMVSSGGNRRGFLKSLRRLDDEAVKKLKRAWNRFYGNNEENVIVLNEGIDFKEAANTVVEMQLNENKKTNAESICNIFLVPPRLIIGGATDEDRQFFIDNAIKPVIEAIEKTLNHNLLLESEKGSYFFAVDTKTLVSGDIEKRFKAYEIALKSNIMKLDEVRNALNLPKTGFNYIKLGLQDVLLDPDTSQIYTPNTNAMAEFGKLKPEGGETDDESGNKSGE